MCLMRLLEIQELELKQLSSATPPSTSTTTEPLAQDETKETEEDEDGDSSSLEKTKKNLAITRQQLKRVDLAKKKYKVRVVLPL
jgi:hypothetical protein